MFRLTFLGLLAVIALTWAALTAPPASADQCYETDYGTVCVADPPPPPPCAPRCPAPPWQIPMAPNITLCHVYGYCQNYCNGEPCGQAYLPTDPLYGPWQHYEAPILYSLFPRPPTEWAPAWNPQPCPGYLPEVNRYFNC